MNILVVGGTSFLGRHIVEAALANGHIVTLFNRGKTNPDLFPDLEKLRGDRKEGDYAAVADRHWDAIIDPSAYYPRAVRELLEAATCDHYTFISTISVYADNSVLDQDESAGVIKLDDPTTEEVTGATYGGLKVLCEETVMDSLHEKDEPISLYELFESSTVRYRRLPRLANDENDEDSDSDEDIEESEEEEEEEEDVMDSNRSL